MRITPLLICALLAVVYTNADDVKSYSGHQLWRLRASNKHQTDKLQEFSRRAYQYNVNFWSEEFRVDLPVRFHPFFTHPSTFSSLDRCEYSTGIHGQFPYIPLQ